MRDLQVLTIPHPPLRGTLSRRARALRSKLKLQCELNRARSPHLIQRIESAVRSAGTQTVRQCLRRAAKECVGQVVGRIAKVRMIKDVEELCPKQKLQFLIKLKLSR